MSQLKPRIKHISLKFMGEGWEEGFVQFRSLRFKDLKLLDPTDTTGESLEGVLKSAFIAGQGIDTEGKPLPLKAEDLSDFDIQTQKTFVEYLTGQLDPND